MENLNLLSPTSMMTTLSLQSDDTFLTEPIENKPVKRLSLADITVAVILETYKHDTDLLKHILAAKTEEDKRKSAEELRRAEEARLQSKYIDLQIEQARRSSLLDDASLGLSPNDWLSQVNNSNNDLLSPSFLINTPPTPYTLFDTELNLSAPSSPEPPPVLVEKISLTDNTPPTPLLVEKINLTDNPPPPPSVVEKINLTDDPPPVKDENIPPPTQPKEKASCKRTFSRTRSTRKPSVRVLAKKNRYGDEKGAEQGDKKPDDIPLDHDTVMEALRAKLKRSSQQLKEQKNVKEEITSMSPTGILLLDLKNPKKSFPIRARASVVRKPRSFISAHKPKETNVTS